MSGPDDLGMGGLVVGVGRAPPPPLGCLSWCSGGWSREIPRCSVTSAGCVRWGLSKCTPGLGGWLEGWERRTLAWERRIGERRRRIWGWAGVRGRDVPTHLLVVYSMARGRTGGCLFRDLFPKPTPLLSRSLNVTTHRAEIDTGIPTRQIGVIGSVQRLPTRPPRPSRPRCRRRRLSWTRTTLVIARGPRGRSSNGDSQGPTWSVIRGTAGDGEGRARPSAEDDRW